MEDCQFDTIRGGRTLMVDHLEVQMCPSVERELARALTRMILTIVPEDKLRSGVPANNNRNKSSSFSAF